VETVGGTSRDHHLDAIAFAPQAGGQESRLIAYPILTYYIS
jgi:hypothetical protein